MSLSPQTPTQNGVLKADFHLHTRYSPDCKTELESIIARCQQVGINCIAVTDHGAVDGGLRMKELAPFTVIPGEEVLTPNGEMIGLFIKDLIPKGLQMEEVADRIHAQGGLVLLPHPFDTFRGLRVDSNRLEKLAAQVDIIEVFNARSPIPQNSNKARDFARRHGLPGTVGSDSHSTGEIGKTYVEMPAFTGRDDFLQALRSGQLHRHHSSILVHFRSVWARVSKV